MSFLDKAKNKLSGVFNGKGSSTSGNSGSGPAIEYADGSKEWFRMGKSHNADDGPAVFENDQLFTGNEGAERQALETQAMIDATVSSLRNGLPQNMTVGRPLRYRTGFSVSA